MTVGMCWSYLSPVELGKWGSAVAVSRRLGGEKEECSTVSPEIKVAGLHCVQFITLSQHAHFQIINIISSY